MGSIPSEMLRGHMDTIILLSLLSDDKHTNQIREEIEARGDGKFELKQGTFYSCLQRIVKQGYVTEYRSTSADGVRRKFYQLTEKGKIYIDENKDKWAFSREVINTLISTPQADTKSEIVETKPKVTSSITRPSKAVEQKFDEDVDKELQAFLNSEEPSVTGKKASSKAEVVSAIAPSAFDPDVEIIDFNEINAKIEADKKINQPITEAKTVEKIVEKPQIHKPSVPIEAQSPEAFEVNILVGYDTAPHTPVKVEEIHPEEVVLEAPPVIEQPVVATVAVEKTDDLKQKFVDASPISPKFVSVPEAEDDYFNGETTVTHDYKAVLSKIFPTEKVSYKEASFTPREINYVEGTDINAYFDNDSFIKQTANKPIIQEQSVENKEALAPVESNESFDFSDLKSLAKIEGFKIRLSGNATKQQVNKILVNKLNLFTSIIFFVLLAIETLLLGYFTARNAGLDMQVFYILASCLAILPISALIIYLVNPNKKIASLPSMKSVIELCIVIMLNLVLIVIVCGILYDIDFSNNGQLLKFVLYPFIAILNIPFYFIIKYLNLENQKFYS